MNNEVSKDQVSSKNRRKKLIIIGSLLALFTIIIIGIFIYLDWSLTPLPEIKRNISSSDIKIIVDFPDRANRTPIIRTYTKEEFINFNQKEIEKIKDTINGNIEGDIPALVLENGNCVGIGTHKELLQNCEVYKQIALSQLSKEELENG